jgi:hypothetical protein
MNTNLNSPIASPRTISGEGWAAIAGAVGSALLLAKKLLSPKPAKPSGSELLILQVESPGRFRLPDVVF